jgi:hypothetical protein
LIDVFPSRISLATENQLRTLLFLLISLYATITNVYCQDFWREVRKEEKAGWVRIATISHRIKIEKEEERPRGRYSQYFTAGVQCKGRDEGKEPVRDCRWGGYDDGNFHPSTNPHSGGPEGAAHLIGCMHGV